METLAVTPMRRPLTRFRNLPNASRQAIYEARTIAEVVSKPKTGKEVRERREGAFLRVIGKRTA